MLAGLLPLALSAPAHAARKPKIVYLTFDDGPDPTNSPRLLRLLAREHVPATFFLVGQYLAQDPEHATRLWLGGHAVGNHTWSHPNLTGLDAFSVQHQVRATQRLMGPGGSMCVRPPYGAVSPSVSGVLKSMGYRTVLWTVDPQDWAKQDSAYITRHVLGHVRDRSVVLLHDGGGPRSATINAVKTLIPQLRKRGYEFRTVPACRVPFAGSMTGAAVRRDPPREPVDPSPSRPNPIPSQPGPGAPPTPTAAGMTAGVATTTVSRQWV